MAAKPNLKRMDIADGERASLSEPLVPRFVTTSDIFLYWENVKKSSRHPMSGAERKKRNHLSLAVAKKCGHQGSLLGLCLGRRSYKTTVKRRKGRLLNLGDWFATG